jgi:hypothetical protein
VSGGAEESANADAAVTSTARIRESLSVPSHERLRLDAPEELSPLDESGEDDQRESGGVVRTARLDPTLGVEPQLLREGESLGGQF